MRFPLLGTVPCGLCPILGADWEWRSAASCGQTRSDAAIVAVPSALTCGNAVKQRLCWPARPVRDKVLSGCWFSHRTGYAVARVHKGCVPTSTDTPVNPTAATLNGAIVWPLNSARQMHDPGPIADPGDRHLGRADQGTDRRAARSCMINGCRTCARSPPKCRPPHLARRAAPTQLPAHVRRR